MTTNNEHNAPFVGRKVMYILETGNRVEENVRQQMRAIRILGARLTACCLSGYECDIKPDKEYDHLIKLGLSQKQLSGNRFRAVLALRSILKTDDNDTLICNQYKAVTTAILATAFTLGPKPKIVALLRGYNALSSKSRRRTYRLFSRRLSGIIALTAAQKQHFLSLAPFLQPEKIHVVPNHLDYDTLRANMLPREQARYKLGLPQNALVIGCITRFDSLKRIEDLIGAMPKVLAREPRGHLSLIGKGRTWESNIKQIRELGLTEHVTLHGYQPNASRLLKAFDIFAFPSEADNFARVLLEAMAAELPIVAVDAGGTPEVVASNVHLVPPRSSHELASALLKVAVLNPQQRLELGRNAYYYAKTTHTALRIRNALQQALDFKQ